MIDLLYFLLKVSGIFSILYLVYFSCFSRLTFHKLNRAYLLAMLPSSLILPIIKIEFGPNISAPKGLPLLFDNFANVENNLAQVNSINHFELNFSILFSTIYSIVVLIFLIRMFLNIFKLVKIKRRSVTQANGRFSIINTKGSSTFSFFGWIFLPQNTNNAIAEQIIEHEKLHGKSYHTFDLIVVELFVAFFWFNPMVYFYRRDLKSVHEFQIDSLLLKGNLKISEYLQLLLNNLNQSFRTATFCNNFNGSTMEKRIKMMTKIKSSKWESARYLLLLPLIALITMAFSGNSMNDNNTPDISPLKANAYNTISSGYGIRMHPIIKEKKFHYGIDFVAKIGTPVLSTANGTVTRVVFLENSYGKLVEIDHGNNFITRYAQLNDYVVKVGDKVKKGDLIAYVGQSGLSTGPHLHYEVIINGENVDPKNYIKE